MDSSPAPDERSKIPDLMRVGAVPVDMAMDVDTSVLDPVVNNQDFCRFVLERKGFLHSFSKITLSVNNDVNATFPAGVGVHSLIRRCALRIGTTVIAEIDDFNHWMSYKSMFIDNDINLERETYLSSRIINHDMFLNNDTDTESNTNASNVCLKTKLEYDVATNGIDGVLETQPELRTSNAPSFSVSVADLFPFLRFNQLPLYMIDQQVSIELHFEPSSSLKRCICAVADKDTLFTMDLTQTKFIADYIYYDGEMMNRYAEENKVMNWTYNDYRLNKRTLTQAQLQTQQILEIGGAGRLINKIVSSLAPPITDPADNILNNYVSVSPSLTTKNNGLFTTNLIYNDNRLYPVDRSNPAVHFHDVVQAEQNVPQITREEFNRQSGEGGFSDNLDYIDKVQSSSVEGLSGLFHHICYRLNRNERVNSKGVELQLLYSVAGAGAHTHRSWLEMVKTATLDNGRFATDFA